MLYETEDVAREDRLASKIADHGQLGVKAELDLGC